MLFSDGNTLDLCRGACRANAVCYAFDFNFIRGECYIHDAGYLKRLGQKADGVDQYRRQPCYTATEKFQTTKMSDSKTWMVMLVLVLMRGFEVEWSVVVGFGWVESLVNGDNITSTLRVNIYTSRQKSGIITVSLSNSSRSSKMNMASGERTQYRPSLRTLDWTGYVAVELPSIGFIFLLEWSAGPFRLMIGYLCGFGALG